MITKVWFAKLQEQVDNMFSQFQIIDVLVRLLQFPLGGSTDQNSLILIFKAAYDVLHTYMIGNSRKNALYFAKYIDFFQTQFSVKVLYVCQKREERKQGNLHFHQNQMSCKHVSSRNLFAYEFMIP